MHNLNILTEDILTLTDAAKEIPTRPNISTVWRWHTRGISGIKLETCRVGSQLITSRQAITRFLEATNVTKKTTQTP